MLVEYKPCKKCGCTQRYLAKTGHMGNCPGCVRRKNVEKRKTVRPYAVQGARRCTSCGILLDHPATVDCGDTCGVCHGDVQRHIPPATLWDWKPFVVEYA